MESYRFVVAFRAEKSSNPTYTPQWRGWVEQVYPSADSPRRWFDDLGDVSVLITAMIESED